MRGVALLFGLTSCVAPFSPPQLLDHMIKVPGGSGVVVADGAVLTARHVADGIKEFETHLHPSHDVALVRMPTTGKTAAQIAPRSTRTGEKVLLVGIAQSRSEVISGGFSGKSLLDPNIGMHTAENGPGLSGAGVFDDNGRLVGINLGCYLVLTPDGTPIPCDPEQNFIRIEAFEGWLLSIL